MHPEVTQGSSRWTRFFVSLLFFGGFPLLLFTLGYHFVETRRLEGIREERLQFLDQQLFRLKRENSEVEYLNKQLNEFYGLLNEGDITEVRLQERLKTLPRDLSFLSFFFFDASGNVLPIKTGADGLRGVLTRMYAAFREYELVGQSRLMQKYRPFFQSLLGEVTAEQAFTEKGTMIRITVQGKSGFLYWNSFEGAGESAEPAGEKVPPAAGSRGGMMVVYREQDIPYNLAAQKLISALNQENQPTFAFGIQHLDSPQLSLPARKDPLPDGTGWPRLGRIFSGMRTSFQSHRQVANGVFSILPLDMSRLAFGFARTRDEERTAAQQVARYLMIAYLLLVVSWSYRVQVSGSIAYVSISRKMVVLFLFATAIPVTSFLLLGYQYVLGLRQVLIQKEFQRLEGLSNTIDENFGEARKSLLGFYRRLSRSRFVSELNFRGLDQVFQYLRHKGLTSQISLINRNGKTLYSSETKDGRKSLTDKFLPTLARKLFSRRFGDEGTSLQNRISDTMVESLTDSVAEFLMGSATSHFIDMILSKTGHLHELEMGKQSNFIFSTFVFPRPKKEPLLLSAFCLKRRLCQVYLDKIVFNRARQSEQKSPTRLAYVPVFSKRGIIPVEYSKYRFAKDMFQKIVEGQTKQSGIQEIGGERYLVVGTPLSQLPEFILFAMVPQKYIDQTLQSISRRVWLISLLSAIFAVFIGLTMSRQFLGPVRELSTGLSAIERRDFNHRLPPLERDELGDMSRLLNTVLEGMKDLEVARIVQESLFPAGALNLGTYRIFGKSRAMTDIGGDYLDYFRAGEDRIVGLIGDVSGHGVSAALIMGMAKCAFTMHEERTDDLVGNLQQFSRFLLKTIHRKKMMTLFHFCMDTSTHEFRFGNAGHNFPFLFRAAAGTTEEVRQETFPLGMRLKAEYQLEKLTLAPGDAILFYTDGLVEAQDAGGKTLDYSLAREWFLAEAKQDPEMVVEKLFARFDAFTRGTSPADDVSLICLKRLT